MKIKQIKFENFRIYKGVNEVDLEPDNSKNISVIAGKNGFGKTTFLTSLIWVFYGKMMGEVEDKYRRDIKSAGGYDKFLKTLMNRDVAAEFNNEGKNSPVLSVMIELKNLSIPSIPCNSVKIKRSYNLKTEMESLTILIDGIESELSKEVGNEVFINDFILPREIAKFFFFDAEKIVSLAEAKSKQELKNLSKAYSEVLGIKKYEDLKKNLETLLSKSKRDGASKEQKAKLEKLVAKEHELQELQEIHLDKLASYDKEISSQKALSDGLQEKLIREGNGITLEELQALKKEREEYKTESVEIKNKLRKLLDIAPIVLAGGKLLELKKQLDNENLLHSENINKFIKTDEFESFSKLLLKNLEILEFDSSTQYKIVDALKTTISEKQTCNIDGEVKVKVLLDYDAEQYRNFDAVFTNIKTTFSSQFNEIVKLEKDNRLLLSRVVYKIKQAEARSDNHLVKKIRIEKDALDKKIASLLDERDILVEEGGILKTDIATNHRLLSEIEKNINLEETDRKKHEVLENLLLKINRIIQEIKEDKKYSLQKSLLLGLKKIMHKEDFITSVKVSVSEDIMDIELLDSKNQIIDKDSLSKGEQQLYATALLKALVDESGIKFPVFIDSPLQKFDKYHSKNIIKEFYPEISEQVVLFPLLEKELSQAEYEYLKPNVNKVYIIENEGSSIFVPVAVNNLFNHLKTEIDVYSN
jgi:DNA sulfur modification protein DndD